MISADAVLNVLERQVADGMIIGGRAFVERGGQDLCDHTVGQVAPGSALALSPDAVFRIGSMSKPLCAFAALQMMDEGLLDLDDEISRFAPEFLAVARPASYSMPTIRDLLRHTAGLAYPHEIADEVMRARWTEADLHGVMAGSNGDTFVAALASLPFSSAPGTAFSYGYATDLLGCLLERIENAPLDAILAARISGPLGMTDTGFELPVGQPEKVAQSPAHDREWHRINDRIGLPRSTTDAMFSAGGGMVSTIGDYARFIRALLFNGTAFLSERARAEFFRNQLPDGVRGPDAFCGHGFGFGLAFAVRHDWGQSAYPAKAGELTWSGIGGTAVFFNPAEDWFALYFAAVSASRALARMQFRWAVETQVGLSR